jgi:hypothetical protein
MNPEDLQRIYYQAYRDAYEKWHADNIESTKPEALVQKNLTLGACTEVGSYSRRHYEQENERLRDENRTLKEAITKMIEADARPRPAIFGS